MSDHHFSLKGQVIAVTGGSGVLGRHMAQAALEAGAIVALLSRSRKEGNKVAQSLDASLERTCFIPTDVTDKSSVEHAADQILGRFGRFDGLINAAGGNHPKATTQPSLSFFDIPESAWSEVYHLNLTGTVLACQAFGCIMAEQQRGVILNISSMNGFRPLTRIPAYSAAKAAVSNFTQWLAVHMAREYSPSIRVNALAPGFFLTEQNRFLLIDKETGSTTERGKAIIDHTPAGRFGNPEDLSGAVLWLLSPASAFVTGAVIPVDGGFAAYSGV